MLLADCQCPGEAMLNMVIALDQRYVLVGELTSSTRGYPLNLMETLRLTLTVMRRCVLSRFDDLVRSRCAIESHLSGNGTRERTAPTSSGILYNRRTAMSTDEKEIIARAAGGDEEAFARLYERYFDRIYRYIYLRVDNQTEAEDLTQEVFVKALVAIDSYRWRSLPFGSWLFRIAHNHVVDHFRMIGKRGTTAWNEDAIHIEQPNPAAIAERQLESRDLRHKIEKLPPAQREVISLRFWGELSVAEVAKVLGKRPGTVKALQHGGIVALKKMFSAESER